MNCLRSARAGVTVRGKQTPRQTEPSPLCARVWRVSSEESRKSDLSHIACREWGATWSLLEAEESGPGLHAGLRRAGMLEACHPLRPASTPGKPARARGDGRKSARKSAGPACLRQGGRFCFCWRRPRLPYAVPAYSPFPGRPACAFSIRGWHWCRRMPPCRSIRSSAIPLRPGPCGSSCRCTGCCCPCLRSAAGGKWAC